MNSSRYRTHPLEGAIHGNRSCIQVVVKDVLNLKMSRYFAIILGGRAKRRHEEEKLQYAKAVMVATAKAESAKKNLTKKASSPGATDEDFQKLADKAFEKPGLDEPTLARWLTNDVNAASVVKLCAENPGGIGLVADEFKRFLGSLERDGNDECRGVFMEGYNGNNDYDADRIGRGHISADALCISIIGCIQPDPLASFMRDAVRGGQNDDGLAQRFGLAMWPDLGREWRGVDRLPDVEARDRASRVFDRLTKLTADDYVAAGAQRDEGGIPFLRFSPEAYGIWWDYYVAGL